MNVWCFWAVHKSGVFVCEREREPKKMLGAATDASLAYFPMRNIFGDAPPIMSIAYSLSFVRIYLQTLAQCYLTYAGISFAFQFVPPFIRPSMATHQYLNRYSYHDEYPLFFSSSLSIWNYADVKARTQIPMQFLLCSLKWKVNNGSRMKFLNTTLLQMKQCDELNFPFLFIYFLCQFLFLFNVHLKNYYKIQKQKKTKI